MQAVLRKLILWPRDPERQRRELEFLPGRLNVISGYSKTGKSALIPIIDYCLGSESCTVPVNVIRDACSWFGVHLELADEELLLARREPGDQKATGDMFVVRSAGAIEVPEAIEKANANVEDIKRELSDIAGLTKLDFDFGKELGAGPLGRPSFRDLVSLLFQPQNVIANPEVFFYKTSSFRHAEKLRSILPYVLGAIGVEALGLQHERTHLRQSLGAKQRDLRRLQELSQSWLGEIRAHYQSAREVGLVESRPPEDASAADLLEVLRGVKDRDVSTVVTQPEVLEEGIQRLVVLDREESSLSRKLSRLRQRRAEMRRLLESSTGYQGALKIRRSRLAIADWLSSRSREESECPLCGATDREVEGTLKGFVGSLRATEAELADFSTVPAVFEREMERVRRELTVTTEALVAVRREREAVAARSEEIQQERFKVERMARFQGMLEEAMERFDALATDAGLATEIGKIQERLELIESRLRELGPRRQLRRVIEQISLQASSLLQNLDIERPQDPVELDPRELTVLVKGRERNDYLWEIGSGANWVGYHVAMLLALHSQFIRNGESPVPSLLVFDQPSQVYFPQLSPSAIERLRDELEDGREVEPEALAERDEDVKAVRAIYKLIASETIRHGGRLQTFVFDHAGRTTWGGIDGIHLVEEWRRGKKLVPTEWLEEASR